MFPAVYLIHTCQFSTPQSLFPLNLLHSREDRPSLFCLCPLCRWDSEALSLGFCRAAFVESETGNITSPEPFIRTVLMKGRGSELWTSWMPPDQLTVSCIFQFSILNKYLFTVCTQSAPPNELFFFWWQNSLFLRKVKGERQTFRAHLCHRNILPHYS